MKTLVTGSSGYLGSNLQDWIEERSLSQDFLFCHREKRWQDLKPGTVSKIIHLEGCRSSESKWDLWENNSLNAFKIANFAKEQKASLIYLSTAGVYPSKKEAVLETEVTPSQFKSDYVMAKYLGERVVQEMLPNNSTILRLFNPYGGKGGGGLFLNDLIKALSQTENFLLKRPSDTRDFIHIYDVCSFLENLHYKKIIPNGVYNLAGGESHLISDVIEMIGTILPQTNDLVEMRTGESSFLSRASIESLEKTFQWRPKISLKQGLEKELKAIVL